VLPLGNVVRGVRHRGSAATGTKAIAEYCHRGNITGGSHRVLPPKESFNRKSMGFVRGECHYTKSIIFPKRERGNAAARHVVRGVRYRQNAATGGTL